MSNFSYCPLISLFCTKGANNKVNRTHNRALRAIYGDCESTFEDLLDRDKSQTIHKKNLQILMNTCGNFSPKEMCPMVFVLVNYVGSPL